MLRGGVAGDGFLQFDPDHQGAVIATGSQIGQCRQGRNAARRARGFVSRCRGVPEAVANGGRHRPEVGLPGEHLTEGVGDVHHADVGGIDLGRAQRRVDDLGGQRGEVVAFFGEVASKIALVTAENPDAGRPIHTLTVPPTAGLLGPLGGPAPAGRAAGRGEKAAPSALGLNRRDLGGREGRPTRSPLLDHCPPGVPTNMLTQSV